MRKKSKTVLLGLCLAICAVSLVFGKGGIRQRLLGRAKAVSADEYDLSRQMRSQMAEDGEFQVRAYYKGRELPYDSLTGTFMLFPDTVRGKIEYRADDGVTVVYSEDMEHLLAYRDGAFREYGFWNAAVPVVRIDSHGQEIGPDTYVPGEMSIYDNRNGKTETTDFKIKLHTRGASSHWIEKKSYRIKFQSAEGVEGKKYPFLGMEPNDEWILYSFYGDESKMREKLGRDLWYDMLRHNGSADQRNVLQMEYCEVYLDDMYMGLYGFGTAVSEWLLFDDKTKDNLDLIFKTTNFTAPTLKQSRAAGNDDKCETLTLKYESWRHPDRWYTIGEYMDLAYYADDAEYQEYIGDYWYEENVIDYWLFLQAAGLDDNELKNIYFSIHDAEHNRKTLMTPWDLDMSWGVEYTGENIFMWGRNPDRYLKIVDFPIVSRMFRVHDRAFIGALQERWRYLRREVITEEKLLGRVREYYGLLYETGVIERDRSRWPEAPKADDIEYIENYIAKRLPYLDGYIDSLQ